VIAGARAGKLGGTRFIFFLYDLLSVVLKVDADGLVILMPNINSKAVSSAAPAEIIPPRAMKLSEKCSLLSQPLYAARMMPRVSSLAGAPPLMGLGRRLGAPNSVTLATCNSPPPRPIRFHRLEL
jgi:hypothetical protein